MEQKTRRGFEQQMLRPGPEGRSQRHRQGHLPRRGHVKGAASFFSQNRDVAEVRDASTRMSLRVRMRSGPDVGFVDPSSTARRSAP